MMKEKSRNPLLPIVTPEQMMAFRSDKPETFTESRVINAVCEAFEQIGYSPRVSVADYLGIDAKDLSSALRIDCGLGLKEVRLALVRHKLETAKQEHPDWNTDQIARHLGFADRSALFRILGEKEYDKEMAKFRRNQGYAARRRH